MFEGYQGESKETKKDIDELDDKISTLLGVLESAGLNMSKWNAEYEELPEDADSFDVFYQRLYDFKERREDALSTFEFGPDLSEEEKETIRRFDREVMSAYGNQEGFLGNGASAEVYEMLSNDTLCVKFITDQERYNENNHMRTESQLLSKVYEHTKESSVRTPYLAFLRIHAKEGHSYGMEKIHGASLSQMLEFPDKYKDMLDIAREADREQLEADLLEFVRQMHEADVVHGDLFKRNIMLDKDGRLFVIDFGKAKQIEFKGEMEEQRKSDAYSAQHSIRDFFRQLDELTQS